jgi:hypothetical protein
MATLQERLDEFKKSFESGAPPYNAPGEVIEKMHRATSQLKGDRYPGTIHGFVTLNRVALYLRRSQKSSRLGPPCRTHSLGGAVRVAA